MRNLVEILVKALVEEPGAVTIEEVADGNTVTYEVSVANDDLGKIIGRQGRVANALRTVAKAAGLKDKKNVYVKILP